MKLINKDALVAEIKKHLEYANNGILYAQTGIEKGLKKYERELNAWQHCQSMCKNILSFIDTLEVKDLQEEPVIKDLWKDAQGDDLPEIDREVVVFTQDFPNDAGIMAVAIGHRPNPEGWDGKSLSTGKVEHYTPQCYDKGGWNIPDVKYWLDVVLPKEIEL